MKLLFLSMLGSHGKNQFEFFVFKLFGNGGGMNLFIGRKSLVVSSLFTFIFGEYSGWESTSKLQSLSMGALFCRKRTQRLTSPRLFSRMASRIFFDINIVEASNFPRRCHMPLLFVFGSQWCIHVSSHFPMKNILRIDLAPIKIALNFYLLLLPLLCWTLTFVTSY